MGEDGMLDIVALVVVLGIVIATGFSTFFNTAKDVKSLNQIAYEDKNSNTKMGEDVQLYDESTGKLNKFDLVLCTQVQDYYMPDPKAFTINGKKIDITSTYESDLYNYALTAWDLIKNDPDTEMVKNPITGLMEKREVTYDTEYNLGKNLQDPSDDTYIAVKGHGKIVK